MFLLQWNKLLTLFLISSNTSSPRVSKVEEQKEEFQPLSSSQVARFTLQCTPLWYPSGSQVIARGAHLHALSRYNWSLAIRYVPYIPDQGLSSKPPKRGRHRRQYNDWYQSKGKDIALAVSWWNASCQLRGKMSSTDSKWADGRLQWMDSKLLHKDCLSSAHKRCTIFEAPLFKLFRNKFDWLARIVVSDFRA